jgi:LAO/AO transport system kinase
VGQIALELFEKIKSGDRVALSRAITLIESQQASHIDEANALLDACMTVQSSAMRIAVTGAPGVGKSSLIESLSAHILANDHKLAVLAIDPSSRISGGSILGDKTRMQALSNHPNAFVRPSPTGKQTGGVAGRTREAVLLCESAGFDTVIVETVGVGQSETEVRTMVDLVILLLSPGGGDEVQGIKRGILEGADLVFVNKADGDLMKQAQETRSHYIQALRLLRTENNIPPVLLGSALEGSGVSKLWKMINQAFTQLCETEMLGKLRSTQNVSWFEHRIRQEFVEALMEHPDISGNFEKFKVQIASQNMSVRSALSAMHEILEHVISNK